MTTYQDPDDLYEIEYDNWAAEQYAGRVTWRCSICGVPQQANQDYCHEGRPVGRCPNYGAPYCMDHDYDHVLERRENNDFVAEDIYWSNEFAAREREQEERAFMSKMERDERLGWTR